MTDINKQLHWENIYRSKQLNEVSWFQDNPATSLELIIHSGLPLTSKIIDVGGGDSFLADRLLEMGYQDITVLDISRTALERAKTRLGHKASLVKWIVSDAVSFQPTEMYDLWHDRAAFHFLTSENEINTYLETARQCINPSGVLILGTFSEMGPRKCSGIVIRQYSEESMVERLKNAFEKTGCVTVDHVTPFNTIQNFIFCSFRKLSN